MKDIKTFEDLLIASKEKNIPIYKIVEEIESKNMECCISAVREKVKINLDSMKEAIKRGMQSSEMSFSGMCGQDCEKLKKRYEKSQTLFSETFQKILLYSFATIEENLRMGKIAACPTAGSCGIVPSVITAVSETLKSTQEDEINALLTAGMIGKIISEKMSLAGAVAGCQAECGVAASMAAGALVQLFGGESSQIINAAALALKNIMGLVCDPVAGLVEVPCVKRNSFLAMHATVAAELALAGIESVIPADEIVDAVKQVGQLMSVSLKESSEAGLAVTKTGIAIAEKVLNH